MKINTYLTKIAALMVASLLLGASALSAANAVVSPSGASTNSIISSNAVNITQVTVANSSTNTLLVRLVDAPSTSLTWTNASYIGTFAYTTNIVTTFTNFTGVVQNQTNSYLYTYTNTVAANTNSYNTLVVLTVPASETLIWTPSGGNGINANFGVLSTNNQACAITVQYSTTK